MPRERFKHECEDEACQECCTHDDIDHGECMSCGKDCLDLLIMRAEAYYEGDR